MKSVLKVALGVILGLTVLVVGCTALLAAGVDTPTDEPESAVNTEAESSAPAPAEKTDACGSRATDDCTPSVGPNESVRVDALRWTIEDVKTAKQLGDQEFGFGAKADDVFVVVTVNVRSLKNESATLTSEAVQLESRDGAKYDADSEGTTAALGEGEDPLFLEDLGPDQTTTSRVVFDVPQRVLDGRPRLRFNELGFGSTHGYIRLPSTSG